MAVVKSPHEFTKYERARILGARALQISMDAPVLLKIESEEMENLRFDPLKIAQKELESNVLPISIIKPMPVRKEEEIEKVKIEKPKEEDIDKEKKLAEKGEKEVSEDKEFIVEDEEESFGGEEEAGDNED